MLLPGAVMKRKALATALILALLLSVIVGTRSIGYAHAQSIENITINNDGSVTPSSAPVTVTGNIYTLNRDIYGSVTIEKSYVIFNGGGFAINASSSFAALTLQPATPLFTDYVLNVTISNVCIKDGERGIIMRSANNSIIANNTISNVGTGVSVDVYGTGNIIAGNNLTNINGNAVWVWTTNNTIVGNYIKANSGSGIRFSDWSGNTVTGNHIENNSIGVACWAGNPIPAGLINLIYYNNFINNTLQFLNEAIFKANSSELLYPALVNVWDNGTVGNYWSDYNGNDSDGNGIGDTPYLVEDHYPLEGANDTDNCPLMNQIEITVPSLPIPTPTPTPTPSPTPTISPTPWTTPTATPNSSTTATPTPESTSTPEIPEVPSWIILPIFTIAALEAALLYFKKRKNGLGRKHE
jgi:parallel beta-helix repeat protein